MTTTSVPRPLARPAARPVLGPLGRLGLLVAQRRRRVFLAWALLGRVLGAFAPRVESALAGAGWEASRSESVQARAVVQRDFGGLSSSALQVVVHTSDGPVVENGVVAKALALLKADTRISTVVEPQPGLSISQDGQTAIIQAGAATNDPSELVRAADDLKGPLRAFGIRFGH